MADKQLEAIIWCPACRTEKGRLFRSQAGNEGVYVNAKEPADLPKSCDVCATNLERKH